MKVDTKRKGIETWVKKLSFGVMSPHVKHATIAKKHVLNLITWMIWSIWWTNEIYHVNDSYS